MAPQMRVHNSTVVICVVSDTHAEIRALPHKSTEIIKLFTVGLQLRSHNLLLHSCKTDLCPTCAAPLPAPIPPKAPSCRCVCVDVKGTIVRSGSVQSRPARRPPCFKRLNQLLKPDRGWTLDSRTGVGLVDTIVASCCEWLYSHTHMKSAETALRWGFRRGRCLSGISERGLTGSAEIRGDAWGLHTLALCVYSFTQTELLNSMSHICEAQINKSVH